MEISGNLGINSVQSTSQIGQVAPNSELNSVGDTAMNMPVDRLDLSAETGVQSVNAVSATSGDDMRLERIAEIRRAIADGTYDTEERMSAALDRFLERVS